MDNAPSSTSPYQYDSSSAPEDQFQPQTQTQTSQFNASAPEVHNSYFSKLYELARFHFDSANYFQGLFNIDKCIEHLLTNLDDGNQSPVLQDFISKIVSDLNELALNLLKADKPHECLRILEKCKEYTTPDKYGNFSRLRSLTYNHIGCCYRRLGNLEKALYYLQKVLILVEPADRIEILGITHINLCAVLSQMNNHKKALEQARLAVSECAYDLIHASNATGPNKQSDVKKKATMLAIAYHNLGIEESFCNDEDAALQAYFKAYKLVEEHSGIEDKLYEKFKQAHDMTLEKIMKEAKSNKPKKRMPSLNKRKKGKLSPKNWYIKRAPSYSTNALAAKVYLQNGRVVVPDFKDYQTQIEEKRNQSSRSRSRSNRPMSSKTQTNSSSIIKPVQPIGLKPRLKKKQRPLTAASQAQGHGHRFSSGEPSKISAKTSHKNLYDSQDQYIQEDDGPSGDDSELEKFVLEDEQELEWINMKSNRLAFLSDLNQFGNTRHSTDPRVEKTFNPRSPNESLRSPPNNEGFRSHTDFRIPSSDVKSQSDGFRTTQSEKNYHSSDVQENSPEFVTSSNPFTQPPPNKKSQSFNEKLSIPPLESSASKLSFKMDASSNKSSPFSKISERSDDWSPDSVLRKTNEKNVINPKPSHHQQQHKNHNDLEYVEDSSLEAKESATLLQNHYNDAQKKLSREGADSERVFKVLAKTVNSSFEKRLAVKGHLPYFVLMMYNWDEEYISIQVKNLQTNKLFKSVVKYQRKSTDNSPTKEAVEEIREYCESLLERLSIIDGCIVFAEDRQVIGSYIESKLFDKSKESTKLMMASASEEKLIKEPKAKPKVVIDIPESLSTPRETDTEIRPLLTGSHRVGTKSFDIKPKSTKSDAQSSREFMKGFPLHESMHYQATPKDSTAARPPSDKRKNVRPFSGIEYKRPQAPSDVESEGNESKESKKEFPRKAQKGSSFKQNPKFDSGRRKEDPNYRVIFEDNAQVQGHELEFKIFEKINEHPEDFSTYRLACFDKDTVKNIKGLDIPRNSLNIKTLTVQSLLAIIEVDLKNGELYFKNEQSFNGKKEQTDDEEEEDLAPKPLFAKKPLRIESPTDVEESIPDSKSLTSSPETTTTKKKANAPPNVRRTSYQSDEENTFRIKPLINRSSRQQVDESPEREQLLQLDFGKGKSIDCFVSHDKKKNKVLVKYPKSENGHDSEKTLSLRGETLGIPIQGFPPGSFEENMKNLLQSKLILKDGDLVLGGNSHGQSNISIKEREEIDEEIPETMSKRKTEDSNIEVKPLINRAGIDFSRENKQTEEDGSSSKEIRPIINRGYNDSARKRRYVANPTPRSANQQQQQQANRMSLAKTTLNEVELMNEAMNINEAFKDRRGTLGNLKNTQEESNQEIEEELPDLNAEDVQAATMKIQQAYLRKKNNKKKDQQQQKEVIKPLIAPPKQEKQEEEIQEELPDLNAKDVQDATMKIQNAYLRKKNKKAQPPAVPQPKKQPTPEPERKEEPEDELPDLNAKDVQDATMKIQQAYMKKKAKKQQQPVSKPKEETPKMPPPEEPEDELPDLNAKDVQDATMKIQNAYLRKKKNQGQAPKIPNNKAPEQHKIVAPIAEVKKPVFAPPKQEEPEEELPDLNAKDVQDATMKIQNAYLKKKKNRENVVKNDPTTKVDMPPQQQTNPPVKEQDDEELPDLNAKDVQDATMKIQQAYMKKKAKKQQQPVSKPKEETPKMSPPEEPEEELPDLNAKDVQDATMKIQQAYMRKKAKAQQSAKPKKEEEPEFKPLIVPVKKPEPEPTAAEEEEELPDIQDPEIQKASLAIQKAYLKKKNRNKPAAQEPPLKKREDDLAKDFPIQKGYLAKKDDKFVKVAGDAEKDNNGDDELPDLNAKDVQDATAKIQKAYIKKKRAKEEKTQPPPQPEPTKEEDKEEMPDLEDPGVQKSTLAIQKAYMKRKARQQQKQEPVVKKEEPKPKPQEQEQEELPNLEDPGVQKSTLAIQKAYMKKKARQKQKQEQEKPKEKQPEPEPPAKKEEEEKEELPDLEDPGVQKSTLAIQKAYMKKKARQQQKQEQPQPQPQPKPQEPPAQKEEEEELPDLEDPGVQKSTLAIQKAYIKKKARQQQKQEQQKPKVEEPPVKKEEEKEELPDLEDPGVQKSTLAIQKAYMKKKARQQQKQEQPQPQPKPEEPPAKKEEEEELPDIQDPEVQNATFAIQKAYKKRMEKLKKSRPPPQSEPEKPKKQTPPPAQEEQEEEELPNLEDPEVEKATLAIQKAYKKRINLKLGHHNPIKERVREEDKGTGESNSEAEHEEVRDQVVLDQGRQTLPESVKRSHIKPHTVPDHLNDEADSPDSGSAGKKPGASHYKTSWRNHRSYTGEIPKIVIHTEEETSLNNNDLQEYIQTDPSDNQYVEYSHPRHNGFEVTDLHRYEREDTIEEDSDLPNLEDPDVQRAAMSIQRAYMKKSQRKAAV